MAPSSDAVFATLLMNDGYLPGAMVLGHSLRDRGAKGKLVALIVEEKLAATTISDLKTVFDDIIPIRQILNNAPANLYLMNRPDLIAAFTKIQLWQQIQYRRIVYIDADCVALRAPNELLTMDTEFAAVPDIGWPDCFNSGMMVLNPNMADYHALLALAERGISFDGADQGLLNMHFTQWERLSFTYNCTPSGNYQYVPAYKHFQSGISIVHFIGRDKPWTIGRQTRHSAGAYGDLLGRWWSVYDKHYRAREILYTNIQAPQGPKKVQDYVAGEETLCLPTPQAPPPPGSVPSVHVHPPDGERSQTGAEQPLGDQPSVEEQIDRNEYIPTPTAEQRRFSAPHVDWEPARAPPPTNSKPEAANFPTQTYDFSADVNLFQPPTSYPEAPKDMWYEVPAKVESEEKLKPIFPWELHAPRPTRVFPNQDVYKPPPQPVEPTSNDQRSVERHVAEQVLPEAQQFSTNSRTNQSVQHSSTAHVDRSPVQSTTQEPSRTAADTVPQVSDHSQFCSQPPSAPPKRDSPPVPVQPTSIDPRTGSIDHSIIMPRDEYVNPWETFRDRSNAWDDMPEINAYVQSLQPPRRGKIQVLHHTPSAADRRDSIRITDFPTEHERPSLPVTPAPIRRPTFWGEDRDLSGELPMAEGVPKQDEWVRRFSSYPTPAFTAVSPLVHESNGTLWCRCQYCGKQNPIAKLEELQRRQSQALLGKANLNDVREPPRRELPGSASLAAVEAAVEKSSPLSARPLKPILKEPHFELGRTPATRGGANSTNSVHDNVTEDSLSPTETQEAVASQSSTAGTARRYGAGNDGIVDAESSHSGSRSGADTTAKLNTYQSHIDTVVDAKSHHSEIETSSQAAITALADA